MRAVVVDERIAGRAAAGARRVVPIRRERRPGRREGGIRADAVVDAIDAAGAEPVVLARPAEADPAAAAVRAVAVLLGVPCIRLPAALDAAAWLVAVAAHAEFGDTALVRRLEALSGPAGEGRTPPVLRPSVLARWAGWVWRPCPRCAGGGAAGGPCGRCGAPAIGAPA
jgi:hypothetical protein